MSTKKKAKKAAMQKPQELIACCGLYCGECFAREGKIADLARDLRKELRQTRFDKIAEVFSKMSWFRAFKDYPQCYDVLGAMVKVRCRKACRQGGGNPYCKIRACCEKKKIDGCWQCEEFVTCGELEFLEAAHGDAHIRNLRKLKKKGVKEFLKGKKHWCCEIRK